MATSSPWPAYILGASTIALSLHCVIAPRKEYPRYGLPFETPQAAATAANKNKSSNLSTAVAPGAISPLIYLKGIREASYGAAFIAFQYQGNYAGVTTMAGIMGLAAIADGVLVWLYGGEDGRPKAFGHSVVGSMTVGWAAYRYLWV